MPLVERPPPREVRALGFSGQNLRAGSSSKIYRGERGSGRNSQRTRAVTNYRGFTFQDIEKYLLTQSSKCVYSSLAMMVFRLMPKGTQLLSEATQPCYSDSVFFIYHNSVPVSPSLREKREEEIKIK